MTTKAVALKAPFPWFGGKSKVAPLVWDRFGDARTYTEPFFGSGAMLLGRPTPFAGLETVNDADGLLCNFWRALQADPDAVAKWADWPVNENDLHARHAWLVERKESLQARLEGDPDFFDAKAAGWWVWGLCCWIGSGWCAGKGPWRVAEVNGVRQLVRLSGAGQGIKRQRVHLGDAGQGIKRQLVHLGNAGRGINRQLVHLGDAGRGIKRKRDENLRDYLGELADRLARVRVCCGDWRRVCGGKSGDALAAMLGGGRRGSCAVFLDPPYADTAGRDSNIYRVEDLQVAHAVRDWAVRHGDDPRFRIALCGYEGEHSMPESWECVSWKAQGGMANQGDKRGRVNCHRERIWFSPHCLRVRQSLEKIA